MSLLDYLLAPALEKSEKKTFPETSPLAPHSPHRQSIVSSKVEAPCWHCGGERKCPCITCSDGLQEGASGKCVICKGTGKVRTWLQ